MTSLGKRVCKMIRITQWRNTATDRSAAPYVAMAGDRDRRPPHAWPRHAGSFAVWILVVGLIAPSPNMVRAESLIGDICRVKGQEANTLRGVGLVVGLNGTGDGDLAPKDRSLARLLQLLGTPIGTDTDGLPLTTELKSVRNVALVSITAEIPAQGGREGDLLDCMVTSIASAKSLDGGVLTQTALVGPRLGATPGQTRVYAFAQGPVYLEDENNAVRARISRGCRLEADFFNPFVKDGQITLVLNKSHAGFAAAQQIEDEINNRPDFRTDDGPNSLPVAKALDQLNIEVRVPKIYENDPVLFTSLLLRQKLYAVPSEARVVVNERIGAVVVGADVEIAPTAVTHNDVVVEVGGGQTATQFVAVDPGSDPAVPKLKALVSALNALQVSAQAKIDIIRMLDQQGAIYGHVIYVK